MKNCNYFQLYKNVIYSDGELLALAEIIKNELKKNLSPNLQLRLDAVIDALEENCYDCSSLKN